MDTLPTDLQRLAAALHYAARCHRNQRRKNEEQDPYINHPISLLHVLAVEAHITDADVLCAALLHDVIEDSPTTREDIAALFGEDIARVVWLLTKFEDVSLADYLAAIEAAGETGATIVKLCDRLDNLRFVSHSPRPDKRERYIRTTETYYLPMAKRTNPYLHDELRRSLEEVRTLVP